jgi:hypothetical protein
VEANPNRVAVAKYPGSMVSEGGPYPEMTKLLHYPYLLVPVRGFPVRPFGRPETIVPAWVPIVNDIQ